MPSFDAYVSDYLIVLGGILAGNVLAVILAAVLEADHVRYLGLRPVSEALPSVLGPLVANLVAVIELSVLPALGVLALLYADYRARPGE